MELSVKERVQKALKDLEITPSQIAKFRDLKERTVLDQINGDSKIGISTIEALLEYCPDVSAEWLLRGSGDMLRKDVYQCVHNTNGAVCQNNGNNVMQQTGAPLSTIEKLIDEMQSQREASTEQISRLLTIIENITNK